MVTRACVRYKDDRHLAIVPVEDIKNFNPKVDYSTSFHMAKWTDATGTWAYYRARILQGGESEEDLKAKLTKRRVRVKPVTEDASSEDEASDGDVAPSKIDIGQGLHVPSETWRRMQAREKDSMFVKDLLVSLEDAAQLQGRSIQGCYKRRLEKQGYPQNVIETLLKRMNDYVGEKIADIDKIAKRMKRE
ncbi:hypothetical protein HPB50_028325 [Hyalomma asiaticum]|nr:hypothetical protein HPB50_028325 [Hyalomma asiaticum]